MARSILAVDFDGTIHSYVSGYRGVADIPDPPTAGAIEFLRHATKFFAVAVWSSRSSTPEGREAMRKWLIFHGAEDFIAELDFPEHKPPAMVILDDRAIRFMGSWPDMEELRRFMPWYQGGLSPVQICESCGSWAEAAVCCTHRSLVPIGEDAGRSALWQHHVLPEILELNDPPIEVAAHNSTVIVDVADVRFSLSREHARTLARAILGLVDVEGR